METPQILKPSRIPRLLYPALIVAAASVTVFSLVGIAGMTGHMPSAFAGNEGTQKSESVAMKMAAACSDCGVIESIRAVEVKGSGSGMGAVIGGVAGALLGNGMGRGNGRTAMTLVGGGAGAYAGNEIEKNTRKQVLWETTVRMEDGSLRKLTSSTQPGLAVGARVKVTNGQVVVRT